MVAGGYGSAPVCTATATQDVDPDRELNPIILQYMAKSTLHAVLADPNALGSVGKKMGVDTNGDRDQVTNLIFSKLADARKLRAKELQRQFIQYMLHGPEVDMATYFRALKRNVQLEREERVEKERARGNSTNYLTEKPKPLAKSASQPDYNRMMNGLAPNKKVTQSDDLCHVWNKKVEVIDRFDPRGRKGLRIKGESAKGKAWELEDGTFIMKEAEGLKWRLLGDGESTSISRPRSASTNRPRSASFVQAGRALIAAQKMTIEKQERSPSKRSSSTTAGERSPSKSHSPSKDAVGERSPNRGARTGSKEAPGSRAPSPPILGSSLSTGKIPPVPPAPRRKPAMSDLPPPLPQASSDKTVGRKRGTSITAFARRHSIE